MGRYVVDGGIRAGTGLSLGAWAWAGSRAVSRSPHPILRRFWLVAAVHILFCLRELDVEKWDFEPGLLETAIFSAPVPIWQKVISALAMTCVLYIVGATAVKGAGPLWRGLRASDGWALAVCTAVLCVTLSVLIDHPAKKAEWLGLSLSDAGVVALVTMEEVVEWLMAMLLALASCLYWARNAPRQAPGSRP